jgi:hypothetical protein
VSDLITEVLAIIGAATLIGWGFNALDRWLFPEFNGL